MKFQLGEMPKWKSKPKPSALDSDVEFQKLCSVITNGTLKPQQYAGVYVDESKDSVRLKSKFPARLVRDRLRKFLQELHLEADYRIVARRTAEPGVWSVGVVLEPREQPSLRRLLHVPNIKRLRAALLPTPSAKWQERATPSSLSA